MPNTSFRDLPDTRLVAVRRRRTGVGSGLAVAPAVVPLLRWTIMT